MLASSWLPSAEPGAKHSSPHPGTCVQYLEAQDVKELDLKRAALHGRIMAANQADAASEDETAQKRYHAQGNLLRRLGRPRLRLFAGGAKVQVSFSCMGHGADRHACAACCSLRVSSLGWLALHREKWHAAEPPCFLRLQSSSVHRGVARSRVQIVSSQQHWGSCRVQAAAAQVHDHPSSSVTACVLEPKMRWAAWALPSRMCT